MEITQGGCKGRPILWREHAEIAVFFAVWLAALLHAVAKESDEAWREQLASAAVLCLALPVLDAVTGGFLSTDGVIPAVRWAVDAVAVVAGIVFSAIVLLLKRRRSDALIASGHVG